MLQAWVGKLWEGGETEITKWLRIVTIIFCDRFIYSLHITYSIFFNRMSNFWFFFFSSDKIRFVFKSCHLTTAIYGKGLTLWHFQNVIKIKTSEILREVLERFQVLRAYSRAGGRTGLAGQGQIGSVAGWPLPVPPDPLPVPDFASKGRPAEASGHQRFLILGLSVDLFRIYPMLDSNHNKNLEKYFMI